MNAAGQGWVLAQRAFREVKRTPDATIPALFIPLFFLIVNVGQAGNVFPSETTPFLRGQSYAGFQLPSSILLASSFGSAALFLVEDIERGYFDKLRVTPISRMAIVLGRLVAEAAKGAAFALVMLLIALPFDVRVASGATGWLLLPLLAAGWAVVYSGFMQLIALKTRSAAATQSGGMLFFPLLFLTPNFVPRDLLTRPMEIAATANPVTYLMEAIRSLILEDTNWAVIGRGLGVVAGAALLMLFLSVRMIRNYD